MRVANLFGVALMATAFLSTGVVAGRRHGHFHKRVLEVVTDVDVVYQTVTDVVWVTVTGSDGQLTTVATTSAPVVQNVQTTSSVVVTPTTPIQAASSVVAPAPASTSSVVAPPPAPTSSVVAPAPSAASTSPVASAGTPTTLSTFVAPTTSAVPSTSVAYTSAVVSTSSAAAAVSSASSSGSKRGLSFNEASLLNLFTGSSLINWCYNWGSASDGTVPNGFEFVPMLWGMESSATESWSTNAQSAIDNGATALLGFNEPDNAQQADLSASDAAAGYIKYMNPFSGSAKLGAPAVTNGGSPGGLTWLSDFLDACNGDCDIDFVPIHWYDSASNYGYFKDHVEQAYVAGGNRTLWITEFGATGSTEEQVNFLQIVMPWLDQQDYVERYAYFMDDVGVLLESVSELSSLGSTFMEYTSSTVNSLIADAS